MPFATNSDDDDEVDKAMQERAHVYRQMLDKRCQDALDRTFASHGGRPVDTVKPELARQWQVATGGEGIAEPRLSAYAEAISAGREVDIGNHDL